MLRNKMLAVIAGALGLFASTAWAQEASGVAASSSAHYAPVGYAAATFETPVGFGAGWGSFGAGAFGQTLGGINHNSLGGENGKSDGSAGVAFGLGDPDKYFGLETSAVFSSLLGSRGDDESFGKEGSLGFKLHTNLPGYAAVSVGVVGAAEWGSTGFRQSNVSSFYTAATKAFNVGPYVFILNGGLGDGVFNRPGKTNIGEFGSGAFYFTNWLSVIGEYSGRFTNAALSIAPIPMYMPLTVTLGAINLGERYGENVEFGASVGVGYSFK